MSDIDFDAVLSQLGEKRTYQNRLFYLLSIPATLPAIFLYFNQVFVSATPVHWCRVPELDEALGVEAARQVAVPYKELKDGTREYSRCYVYDVSFAELLANATTQGTQQLTFDPAWDVRECTDGWHYNRTNYDETLVSQLDLVCDKSWWIATSTTCFCVGSLIGNLLFGKMADKFGRRPTLLVTMVWHVVFSITTPLLTTNYITYTILRTCNALVFPAIYQIPFVISLEIMGAEYRTFAGMMICVFFSLALIVQALITYVLRDWYSLLLYTSVPFVLLAGYYWIVTESPRWLLSKNRVDEAEVIVQRIAKTNGKPIPRNFLRSFQVKHEKREGDADERDVNVSFLDLLRRPVLRRIFLIIAFVWITNAMVYGGLAFNSGNLGVRVQTAFLIGAAVELPSFAVSWWMMDRFGRRFTVWTLMLLGGLSCVSCALVPEESIWVIVTLAMIGRFGISASFAVFYVYVGELLPTIVRSQSMASGSFVGNMGWIVFPYIVYLANFWRVLPLLVFGSLSIAGALATMLLPESLGRPLPQTLSDGEKLHVDTSVSLNERHLNRGKASING